MGYFTCFEIISPLSPNEYMLVPNILNTPLKTVINPLKHRFLTGGPWIGPWGSAKIKKYCILLNLFTGIQGFPLIIYGSMEQKRLRTTTLRLYLPWRSSRCVYGSLADSENRLSLGADRGRR